MKTRRDPAVVINGAVSQDFEILRSMSARNTGIVERIFHRSAMYWHLFDAVDKIWRSNACNVINRGCDVNNVMKLRTQFVGCSYLLWPRNCNCVAGAAEVRCNLFHPLKR